MVIYLWSLRNVCLQTYTETSEYVKSSLLFKENKNFTGQ